MTLRLRMALQSASVTFIAGTVLVIAVIYVNERTDRARIDSKLRAAALVMTKAGSERLQKAAPVGEQLREAVGIDTGLPLRIGPLGLLAQIVGRDGEVGLESPLLDSLGELPLPQGLAKYEVGEERSYDTNISSDRGKIPVRVYERGTDSGVVQVAQQWGDTASYQRRIRTLLGAAVVVATALAGILGWILAGRSLRPIDQMTRSAREIEQSADTSRLVDSPVSDTEVGRLAEALNDLLARQHAAQRVQRTFVADAAHELRSPLTSLSGNVAYLRRHASALTDEELIDDISRSVERLVTAANSLLMLASIDAHQPVVRERVNVDELIDDAVAGARMRHNGHLFEASTSVGVIECDERLLVSMVDNLLDDAGVHTPVGTRIDVAAYRAGADVCMEVRDNGPGIHPDDYERVFERFHRGSSQVYTSGSGLGLAIVRSAARHLGGDVAVDDNHGQGTKFSITIPMVDSSSLVTESAR